MPPSDRRSTVSSWTSSARSIAGSGSARKKRFFVLSAGATTRTSALSASSSPTADRRASADTGSDTRARIFLGMSGLYRKHGDHEPGRAGGGAAGPVSIGRGLLVGLVSPGAADQLVAACAADQQVATLAAAQHIAAGAAAHDVVAIEAAD